MTTINHNNHIQEINLKNQTIIFANSNKDVPLHPVNES